ncbi:MAG: TRAP transporter small permease subunit [Piscinibacter sp.]|uniref:TRAP transporter small permease subunit n=1 Tax=Piscinibacter sp. TaxID=1903157 RepID=UPI001B5E475F|nr:TRAP transporter small permease subunit [Piscinibacter sp.]MBP5989174.1 TRAP transporter small permease subunit [Piscinibacter sp.]MBP6026758.1 TRAP transporter small permease subunit [Piscinibacter sp.]MBS0434334.1 TRAP transporter small permease subunit [Pseudomonadota bacterium]
MNALFAFARAVDWLTDRFGSFAKWAVFLSCFISAGNAVVRYALDISSNAMLEVQWYMFAACVMLGAAQVLRLNEHVRVDVLYGRYNGKTQVLIDLFGLLFFLLPVMLLMVYLSTPLFIKWYESGEMSSQAGGLIRWPAMLTLPLGFALMTLQGVAEVIKRIGWLMHKYDLDIHYERPLQ